MAHLGDVFVFVGGGVVLVLDRIPVLFLPYNKTYGVGVFCSFPNPNRGNPV